jgi:hypothetical protein
MRSLPLCLCLDNSLNKYTFPLYRVMLQFTWAITEKVRCVVELTISYFSHASQCIDSKIECSHAICTKPVTTSLLLNKFDCANFTKSLKGFSFILLGDLKLRVLENPRGSQ